MLNIISIPLIARKEADGTKTYGWGMCDPVPPNNVQVIYVDDLMNAGSTWERCRDVVRSYGEVCAVATIADRSTFTAKTLGVPHFERLVHFDMKMHEAHECPYCAEHRPIVRHPGHGHEFEKSHPEHPGGFIDL